MGTEPILLADVPLSDLLEFLETKRELFLPGAAYRMRCSCIRLAALIPPRDSTVGYMVRHVEELLAELARVAGLKNAVTLSVYRANVLRAAWAFDEYRRDPAWRSSVRVRRPRAASPRPSPRPAVEALEREMTGSAEPVAEPSPRPPADPLPSAQTRLSEVIDFLKTQAYLFPDGGRRLVSSCLLVGDQVEPELATVGYIYEHLDELLLEYARRHPGRKADRLVDHRGRVLQAFRAFDAFRRDPHWRPRARRQERLTESPEREAELPGPGNDDPANAPRKDGSAGAKTFIRVPLRPDFDAEISLPEAFDADDANKLGALLDSLASEIEARSSAEPHQPSQEATPAAIATQIEDGSASRGRVLCVGGDALEAEVEGLSGAGFEIQTVATAPDALTLLTAKPFEAVVLDVDLPGVDAPEFVRHVHEQGPATVVVWLAWQVSNEIALRAAEAGVLQVLQKPVQAEALGRVLAVAVNQARRLLATWTAVLRGAMESRPATASEAKNKFGIVLETAIREGAVVITKHGSPTAVLVSTARLRAVMADHEHDADTLTSEVDHLVTRMRTPTGKVAAKGLFSATAEQLGEAALAGARKPTA